MRNEVFEGLSITIDDDNEIWVSDEELARALGYKRVRDIRQLIARHLPFLPGIQSRCTVQQQSTRNGGSRPFTVTAYVLNESHALYIAAKSNTLQANQLLQHVIKAFLEAKKFIKKLLTAPVQKAQELLLGARAEVARYTAALNETKAELETTKRELALAQQMYDEDMTLMRRASSQGVGAITVQLPPAGGRSTFAVVNQPDTSDGKYLKQVQREFGLPEEGRNSQVVRIIAQQMGFWNDPNYMYITAIDVRDGHTLKRPARKYKPRCRQAMSHTIIRKARELGYTVPAIAIATYGEPDPQRRHVPTLDPVPHPISRPVNQPPPPVDLPN